MESKTALISGITGQDGSYISELLLEKGYEVWGIIRRLSQPNLHNIDHIKDQIHIVGGDLLDQNSINRAIKLSNPDELYHLGAMSFVGASWEQTQLTLDTTGLGSMRIFEAVRNSGKDIKVYQASSSEMYGLANGISPQNESTPMIPRSPYAVAKLMAHNLAKVYRESYNMNIWCGILFNHESPKRGIEFVSRKISDGVARIKLGLSKELILGNIRSKRDFGFAPDYVEAMYIMLQQDRPDDYVIATGESHSVREFVDIAFEHAKLGNWENYVKFDKSLMRPADIYNLIGDASKAKNQLGWKPKTSFRQLVEIMVDHDIEILKGGK